MVIIANLKLGRLPRVVTESFLSDWHFGLWHDILLRLSARAATEPYEPTFVSGRYKDLTKVMAGVVFLLIESQLSVIRLRVVIYAHSPR